MPREAIHAHLDEFVAGVEAWRETADVDYDLVHGNYWLSGVVGLTLRERWRVPLVQMFHTLGRLKNGASRNGADREPDVRIAEETRIVGDADRLIATIGVDNLLIVQDGNATLVADRREEGTVKQLVELLKKKGLERYL